MLKPNTNPTTQSESLNRGWSPVIEPVAVFAVVFAGLVLLRREVLYLPPYEDQAAGYWAEANFLAQSHYDYYRLLYHENHFMDAVPGPRSYTISALPTLLAFAMRNLPSVQNVVFTFHLAFMACGAAVAALTYWLLRRDIAVLPAAATVLAMITVPLFGTQIEIVGMDVPLCVVALLTAACVWKERYVLAAVFSLATFFIKATGGLFTTATIAYLLPLLVLETPTARRSILYGLIANGAVFCLQVILVAATQTDVKYLLTLSGHPLLRPIDAIFWVPDVALLVVGFVLWGIAHVIRDGYLRVPGAARRSWLAWRAALRATWLDQRVVLYCLLVVVGMVMANYCYLFTPRYFACAIPFLFILMARLLFPRPSWKPVALLLVLGLCVFNVCNAHGYFYPDIGRVGAKQFRRDPWLHARSCAFTERSREYLPDHRSTLQALHLLERKYADHPIFLTMPHWVMATTPNLGYVTRRLDCPGIEPFANAVAVFADYVIRADRDPALKDPIFLRIGRSQTILPPPRPEDEMIYDDQLTPPLQVYRKAWPRGQFSNRREIEDWYLDATWSDHLYEPMRIGYLLESGRIARAERELDALAKRHPRDRQIAEMLNNVRRLLQAKGMAMRNAVPR